MDTHYGKKEDRSGVRLISLLGNHLKEILKRESDNRAFIHLYCTGPYWVAFEKSAYLLRQISSRTLVTPLSLTTYPFPIVMVSWTDGELRSYTRNHLFHREGNDYGRCKEDIHWMSCTLVFALIRVRKHWWDDITQGKQ